MEALTLQDIFTIPHIAEGLVNLSTAILISFSTHITVVTTLEVSGLP